MQRWALVVAFLCVAALQPTTRPEQAAVNKRTCLSWIGPAKLALTGRTACPSRAATQYARLDRLWPAFSHPRVGYAAGGGPDINARGLAQVMPAVAGQPAIVDNRAGAGGSIGIRAAAGARPDGPDVALCHRPQHRHHPVASKGMIDTLTALVPICQTTAYQLR